MKIFKWFFGTPGVNIYFVIIKIALFLALLFLLFKGFMNAWHFVAQNEPRSKQKIGFLYNDLVLKNDSLKTAKKQVILLSNESQKKDSAIFEQTELLKNKESQILQHQKNNYDLKKQLEIYRKDNRVCYKYEKVGTFLNKEWQWIEIPCTDIKD